MFKLLKYLKKSAYILILLTIALVILQVYSDMELPTRLTRILENASNASALRNLNTLTPSLEDKYRTNIINNGLEMFMFAGVSLTCSILVVFLASRIAADFSYNLRQAIYRQIQDFSTNEIDKFSTASLITRTTNDITQVQMLVIMVLRIAVAAPTTAIIGIAKASNIQSNSNLNLIVVIAVVTLVVMVTCIFCTVLPKFKKMQQLADRLNLVTRENLTGIRVIRANCAQEYQEEKFKEVNTDITKTNIFVNRTMNIMMPGMNLIMQGTSLAILWIGAYAVGENPLFLGSVFGFQQITMMIVMAFMQLIMIFIMVPRGLVSANRIKDVLDVQSSIRSPLNPLEPSELIKGEIEYRNVSFKYADSDEAVIEDISFKAKKGDVVAIIGSTGSGKTSLINLLPRFFDASSGSILVDGVDVKDYDLVKLREKIGFIAQKSLLFKGTIRSNLKYGKPDASDDEMKEALKEAMAYDFVFNTPDGLDLGVAQGGSNFSGGQKQRLSIARALIKKPEILIFDDSFSALDFKTDKELRKVLANLDYQPTKLIVAQRIGTILDADLIIVLDKGKVVGAGSHKELIQSCEVYQEIAYSQLSKEEIENA